WSVWAYAQLQVPFRLKDENAWYRLHVSMEQEAKNRRTWKQVETVGENLKVAGRQGFGTARGPRRGSRRFPRGVPTSPTTDGRRVSVAGRQGFEPRYRGPEPRVLPLDDLPVPVAAATELGNSDYSRRARHRANLVTVSRS